MIKVGDKVDVTLSVPSENGSRRYAVVQRPLRRFKCGWLVDGINRIVGRQPTGATGQSLDL